MYIIIRKLEYPYKIYGNRGLSEFWHPTIETALQDYFKGTPECVKPFKPVIGEKLPGGDRLQDLYRLDETTSLKEFKYQYPELFI